MHQSTAAMTLLNEPLPPASSTLRPVELNVGGDSYDSETIGGGGDGTRDMSAVPVVVERIIIVVDEVVSAGVASAQFRVGIVDSRVDDRDTDSCAGLAIGMSVAGSNSFDAPSVREFFAVKRDLDIGLDSQDPAEHRQSANRLLRQAGGEDWKGAIRSLEPTAETLQQAAASFLFGA